MWLAMHNRLLTITGTGDETREFAHVRDVVNGILRMGVMDAAIGEVMNLASGAETKVKDLATQVVEVTGSTGGITYGEKRDWDKSGRRLASIEKARKLISYEPTMPFREGLESVHRWLQENREKIAQSVGPTAGLW